MGEGGVDEKGKFFGTIEGADSEGDARQTVYEILIIDIKRMTNW